MPLSSGDRLGPYEIVSPIGAGGVGEVYRAGDTRLGRDVALKILPAEVANDVSRRRRFELEARAMAALNHPMYVDFAPRLRQQNAERWAAAIQALEGHPRVLQVLFTGRRFQPGRGFGRRR
jgi:serine/threonine protein kinase